jgi:putative transposase
MTIPRRILDHTTWLITRRCSERRFFLLPNARTKQVFEYALARAARLTGVLVHAWMVMSNHYHLVVTDPEARLPEFMRILNSRIARALNFCYQRRESFWSPGSYSAVQLCSEAAVLDKLVYTLANPVAAGLVRRTSRWEGASSVGMEFGGVRRVLRPASMKTGRDVEALRLVAPPSAVSTAQELAAALREGVVARENAVEVSFAAQGRRVLGMRAVLAQSWWEAARSEEGSGQLSPRFATRDGEELRRAIREWKEWLAGYWEALGQFRDGVREVAFPAGTYLMKARFNVVVAPR